MRHTMPEFHVGTRCLARDHSFHAGFNVRSGFFVRALGFRAEFTAGSGTPPGTRSPNRDSMRDHVPRSGFGCTFGIQYAGSGNSHGHTHEFHVCCTSLPPPWTVLKALYRHCRLLALACDLTCDLLKCDLLEILRAIFLRSSAMAPKGLKISAMTHLGRVGGRIAPKRSRGLGHPILAARKVLPAEKVRRRVTHSLRKVYKASGEAHRAARRIHRQISVLWWRDTRAVQIAAKLKEDNEASPTT